MVATSKSAWLWMSILAIFAAMPAAAPGGFTVRDLGVIVGSGMSEAEAINSSGEAAGMATGPGGGPVAVQSGGGGFEAVSLPSNATYSMASAINNANDVAGYYADDRGVLHGFYTSGGHATTLNTLPRGSFTMASGINSSNQVVGTGDAATGAIRAFIASAGGSPTAINPLGGNLFSSNRGNGINDNGTVVGTSETSPGGLQHAFFTGGAGAVSDLFTRNAAGNFGFNAYGMAIANSGDIVGYGDVGRSEHAFFASGKGGTLVDLGALPGASSSRALGVNNLSEVVGALDYGSGPSGSRAFLWDLSGGMVDLNTLIPTSSQANWALGKATGINDSGQISGEGYYNGVLHGFVLTPSDPVVPAPPALVLSAVGCGIASAWSRVKLRRGRSGGRAAA